MFETSISSEIDMPIELSTAGIQVWDCMYTRLHVPWLHVVYVIQDSGEYVCGRILFLSQVDQLLQLSQESDIKIMEVNLVSPKHLNNKHRWEMEPLQEIWLGIEPGLEHKQLTEIYVLSNGDRYTDSPLSTLEEELLEKNIIFTIKGG